MAKNKAFLLVLAFSLLMFQSHAAAGVAVKNANELYAAVERANAGAIKSIILAPGVYTLERGLWISGANVVIKGSGKTRDDVVLQGAGMRGGVSHIIWVAASGLTVENLTLRFAANHCIQVHGERGVHSVKLINLHIADAGEQLVKVSYDADRPSIGSKNGLVENCLFEYSKGVGPQYYIGGIDAHNCTGWIVRGNTFKGIKSPTEDVAEHAVHFWSNSRDTLVENNIIINCDRGVGFGLGDRGHYGGLIRNNMIYHGPVQGAGDAGITLESAEGACVFNNTVYMEHGYPNAIEYRFPATRNAVIANNLTNRAIKGRDGAVADLMNNNETAGVSWFRNPETGDLHLTGRIGDVVDQGVDSDRVEVDIDGDKRPVGKRTDIGADEFRY